MSTKQRIFLGVRFCCFTAFWYVVAQIVLGTIYGFIYAAGHPHDHNSYEEQITNFFEDFSTSPALPVIVILSMVFAIGLSSWQTFKKYKEYQSSK